MATVDPNEPTELTGEDKHYQDLLAAGLVGEDDAPEGDTGTPEPEAAAEPAKPEKAPERADTPAEAAAAEEFFPGYANLPEESQALVRQHMERASRVQELEKAAWQAENDRRATVGKLAPTQRELEEAKKKLREFEEKQTTASRSGARDVLDRFRKQYPEEAEAIDAVNSQLETFAEQTQKEKAELLERFEQLEKYLHLQSQAYESTRVVEQARAELQSLHPDYQDIEKDPDWKVWLKAIDPVKQELFERNRTHNAAVIASILTDFKRDRELARLYDLQGAGAASPTTPATKPLARSVADPNPTARRTTAIPRSNSTAGLTGEDLHVANLQAAGYDI